MNYYPYHYRGYPYHNQYYPQTPSCACGYRAIQNDAFTESRLTDQGNKPFVIDIEKVAEQNNTFRTAIWTGKNLQVTVMSIKSGEDVGVEVHPEMDQFLRIEDGEGVIQMGNRKDNLTLMRRVEEDDAIMIPAGTWHNLTNTSNEPLKLHSIYAPPEHPFGTIHQTKADGT